nr:hypothetical protein [Tanacetum cinerariifolium]
MALKEAEVVEAIRLRAEASNFVTMEKSLWDEVNDVNERNTILEKERDALDVKVADLKALVMNKEREITYLSAQLTSVKSHNDSLVDQAIRVLLLSTNERKEIGHVGWGQGHMGRSGRGIEYCSCVCVCTGKAGVRDGFLAGRKRGFASWDLDKVTWEGRVEAMGTIPVCVCTGKAGVRDGLFGGKIS